MPRTLGAAKEEPGSGRAQIISTFGLVSRGKGLRKVIQAMPEVIRRFPDALYLILGDQSRCAGTGELYRNELDVSGCAVLGSAGMCASITATSHSKNWSTMNATVYVTPYVNPDRLSQRHAGVCHRLRSLFLRTLPNLPLRKIGVSGRFRTGSIAEAITHPREAPLPIWDNCCQWGRKTPGTTLPSNTWMPSTRDARPEGGSVRRTNPATRPNLGYLRLLSDDTGGDPTCSVRGAKRLPAIPRTTMARAAGGDSGMSARILRGVGQRWHTSLFSTTRYTGQLLPQPDVL